MLTYFFNMEQMKNANYVFLVVIILWNEQNFQVLIICDLLFQTLLLI